MFQVNLRALSDGPVRTDGALALTDEHLTGVALPLAEPVAVRGRLMESGPGRYFWDARLTTRVRATCRRCLAPVTVPVDQTVKVLLNEGEDPEDPDAYAVRAGAAELDLGDIIREELILAVPDYLVCRDDCRGLCATCGADLNQGPCDCRPEPDPRWAVLEQLKGRPDDLTE